MSKRNKHVEYKTFRFGIDCSPWWFTQAVKQMDVEYVFMQGKVRGCRFYKRNKEIIKSIGETICVYDIYNKMPKQME